MPQLHHITTDGERIQRPPFEPKKKGTKKSPVIK